MQAQSPSSASFLNASQSPEGPQETPSPPDSNLSIETEDEELGLTRNLLPPSPSPSPPLVPASFSANTPNKMVECRIFRFYNEISNLILSYRERIIYIEKARLGKRKLDSTKKVFESRAKEWVDKVEEELVRTRYAGIGEKISRMLRTCFLGEEDRIFVQWTRIMKELIEGDEIEEENSRIADKKESGREDKSQEELEDSDDGDERYVTSWQRLSDLEFGSTDEEYWEELDRLRELARGDGARLSDELEDNEWVDVSFGTVTELDQFEG